MIRLVLVALLLGAFDLNAQSEASTDSLHWVPVPSLLPPGAMIAVVAGNPAGTGPATIVLSMPDGYRIPPHYHPSFERVEIKEGVLLVGMGDRLDPERTLPLAVGDTIRAPAAMRHYSIAKGRTVVSVSFMAPYTITYVNSYQAPRQPKAFPNGY